MSSPGRRLVRQDIPPARLPPLPDTEREILIMPQQPLEVCTQCGGQAYPLARCVCGARYWQIVLVNRWTLRCTRCNTILPGLCVRIGSQPCPRPSTRLWLPPRPGIHTPTDH